jgi:glucose-6-phosphate 1-epimerase
MRSLLIPGHSIITIKLLEINGDTMTKPPESLSIPKVLLSAPDGARAELTLHGAHVLSWVPVEGGEQLFLSRTSEYRPGVAIRGGVPVVFPQFAGRGPLPKHGFVRTLPWKLLSSEGGLAVLTLQDSPATRAIWPSAFRLEYRVELGEQALAMQLRVVNTGTQAFSFTAALHTYLRVEDVHLAAVEGLKGLRYADSAHGEQESIEQNERVTFPGEVDRIYFGTQRPVHLIQKDRRLTVQAGGFTDTVIWNPGSEKGAALADLQPGGYLEFVCIESASIGPAVHLEPGGTWQGTQALTAGA